MGIVTTLRNRLKKGTTTVVDTTAKVGNYIEKEGGEMISKIPGGATLKDKASHITENTVNRIGKETQSVIHEGKDMIHHAKDPKKEDTKVETASPEVEKKSSLGQEIVSGIKDNMK